MKTFLNSLISIIITASLVGGGAYYYLKTKTDQDRNNLQNQISDLIKKFGGNTNSESQLPDEISDNSNSKALDTNSNTNNANTNSDSQTAKWKTYNNKTYKISFKYPETWTLAEKEESTDSSRLAIITMSGSITGRTYYAEIFNSTATAKDFINSYYSKIEAGPTSITSATVAGQSATKFFIQKTGSSTAGTAYVLFKNGSTIVGISSSGTATEQLLTSDINLSGITKTFAFDKN